MRKTGRARGATDRGKRWVGEERASVASAASGGTGRRVRTREGEAGAGEGGRGRASGPGHSADHFRMKPRSAHRLSPPVGRDTGHLLQEFPSLYLGHPAEPRLTEKGMLDAFRLGSTWRERFVSQGLLLKDPRWTVQPSASCRSLALSP